jgi:hypothetical protein
VAAELVVEATEARGGVVASARLGPFDDVVVALGKVLHQTAALLRDGDMGEHLEQAPDAEAASPMTTASGSEVAPPTGAGPEPVATASSSPPAVISATLPPVGSGRDFASLRSSMRPGFRPWLCGPSLTAKWTGMWNSC